MPSRPRTTNISTGETFGQLVKAYREQRGWTQQELAGRWGYTREYVSQIEREKRKVERIEQVLQLADILDIPADKLEAIGRGIPKYESRPMLQADSLQEADNILLQMLLDQAQTKIKLSWLVWHADSDPAIVDDLAQNIDKLEEAIATRRGTLLRPSLQLLAHAHEMMGKIAFDKLDYAKANGHFQEMYNLGDEVHDPDLLALAMIHQSDVMRRRGRYDHAVRFLLNAEQHTHQGTISTNGLRWQTLARTYAEYGHKQEFLRAIDKAEEAAARIEPGFDATVLQFNAIDVLQERGQGYTLLWEPEKAFEVYEQSEQLKPFRPMRDLGVLMILRAQAYAYAGEIDMGVKFALKGLQMARGYQSQRHISRVQRMYDRLSVTKYGKHPRLKDLKDALSTR